MKRVLIWYGFCAVSIVGCVTPPGDPEESGAPGKEDTLQMVPEDSAVRSTDSSLVVVGEGGAIPRKPAVVDLEPFSDEENLAAGRQLYLELCAACHGSKGSGSLAPDLTDDNWLGDGSMRSLCEITTYGTGKGMIGYARILTEMQIRQVNSYILTLSQIE